MFLDECGLKPHGWPFARNDHINSFLPNIPGALASRLKNKNTLPAPCIIQHKPSIERWEDCLLWIISWLVLIWFFLVDWHLVTTTKVSPCRLIGLGDNRIARIRTFYPTRSRHISPQMHPARYAAIRFVCVMKMTKDTHTHLWKECSSCHEKL